MHSNRLHLGEAAPAEVSQSVARCQSERGRSPTWTTGQLPPPGKISEGQVNNAVEAEASSDSRAHGSPHCHRPRSCKRSARRIREVFSLSQAAAAQRHRKTPPSCSVLARALPRPAPRTLVKFFIYLAILFSQRLHTSNR